MRIRPSRPCVERLLAIKLEICAGGAAHDLFKARHRQKVRTPPRLSLGMTRMADKFQNGVDPESNGSQPTADNGIDPKFADLEALRLESSGVSFALSPGHKQSIARLGVPDLRARVERCGNAGMAGVWEGAVAIAKLRDGRCVNHLGSSSENPRHAVGGRHAECRGERVIRRVDRAAHVCLLWR